MKRDLASAARRAARIKLLCLDVDGTLTDGRLYMRGGKIGRAFNVLDGLGVQLFIRAGGIAAIITAAAEEEGGQDIRARAEQMGIGAVCIGVTNKLAQMQDLMAAHGLTAEQTAFMGDDLPDLRAMQQAGFAAAPPTAAPQIIDCAHYITTLPAGAGAAREVCEFLLNAQNAMPAAAAGA